jgi:hypothetical protein
MFALRLSAGRAATSLVGNYYSKPEQLKGAGRQSALLSHHKLKGLILAEHVKRVTRAEYEKEKNAVCLP